MGSTDRSITLVYQRELTALQNGNLPLWRIEALPSRRTLTLSNITWLVKACQADKFTIFEWYDPLSGMWTIRPYTSSEICIRAPFSVVLVRVMGVDDCPLFGQELNQLYGQGTSERVPKPVATHDNCYRGDL